MTAAKPTPVDHTLPDGWQRVRLGGICSPPQYGASAPARDYDPKLPRYVRITDITDHGRLRVDDPKSADPDKVKGYELEPGDLLFARSGSVGRTYLHRPEDGKCVYAGYLIRFRALPNIAAPEYLEHCTHSSVYFNWISSIARRGAQTNVNATEYSSLPILLPPLPEQRAIAAVLDSIDDAIEGAEAVIAATEGLRDALLHDLLTRGLPGQHSEWRDVPGLGTIPADWDVARLVDMLEEGPTNGIYKPDTEYGSGVCLIRIDDFGFGEFESFGNFQRIRATEDEIRRYEVREGDIVVNRVNSLSHIGKSVLIPKVNEPTLFESNMMRVRFDRNLDSRFGAMVLLSDNTRRYFKARAKKAVQQASINQQDVSELPIPLPPLAEQRTIAATLDGVDAAIRVAGDEQDGLRLLKDSTADALLTGRVRADSFVLSREHKLQDSCRQWKAR